MKLGFVSAILPDYTLEDLLRLASEIGYDCIEVMCWPKGKANRRYAGVTHIEIETLSHKEVKEIKELQDEYQVSISGLGYYPNPLTPDLEQRAIIVAHIKRLIRAAVRLEIPIVNTFVGRDHSRSVGDNWLEFLNVWPGIIAQADGFNVQVGIENCPMYFTEDEWPGGQNLANNPAMWERMWKHIPSGNFGLNYDPSHMIWQHIDYLKPIKNYSSRIHHIHAKDAILNQEGLDKYGVLSPPNLWHIPKLPGSGAVDWKKFIQELRQINYNGAICVEVEDRAYEGNENLRIEALKKSYEHLRPIMNNTASY